MHKFLCFGLFLIGSLLMSAITLNVNLLPKAMAIENKSYNNYDNSQRYEEEYSDGYRVDTSQQSNNDDNYGYDDKNKPPEIFPANKVAELGDEWWQWITGLDSDIVNPFTEFGQSGCDVGLQDNGKYLFLVGSAIDNDTGFPEHECGVKQGTSILFPIVNVLCDDLEVGTIFFGANEQEQRICANNLAVNASNLHVNIDGYEVRDPEQYRVDSPAGGFEFTAVEDNPVSIPVGNGTGVADGYWILLKPFKPGEHTITFSGQLNFPDGSAFQAGATYFLEVKPVEKSYGSKSYQQNYPTDYQQDYPTDNNSTDYQQDYPTDNNSTDYQQDYPTDNNSTDYQRNYPTDNNSTDYQQDYPTDNNSTDYQQDYPTDYQRDYPTDYQRDYPTDYQRDYPTDYQRDYPTDYQRDYPTDYQRDYPTDYQRDYPTDYQRDYPTDYQRDYPTDYDTTDYPLNYPTDY